MSPTSSPPTNPSALSSGEISAIAIGVFIFNGIGDWSANYCRTIESIFFAVLNNRCNL